MKKNKTFGEQVQDIINKSGFTNYEIAKKAGITGSTLQRIISPDYSKKDTAAKKVLNALGYDIKIIKK